MNKNWWEGAALVLLDVRENWEAALVHLTDDRVVYLPLSILSRQGLAALPETVCNRDIEIVVVCHHGMRSAQVTGWLLQQGWKNVCSLDGGLDAYARLVDAKIGMY